jgi:hypothetical protein
MTGRNGHFRQPDSHASTPPREEEQKMAACKLCKGSKKCPACAGTGKMQGGKCPYCNGSKKCPSCYGKGKE